MDDFDRIVLDGKKFPYLINRKGEVFSEYSNRKLTASINANGYLCVGMSIHYASQKCLIHRLLATVYLGLDFSDPSRQVDHINGIKVDNRIENLQILTRSQHDTKTSRTLTYKSRHRVKVQNSNGQVFLSIRAAAEAMGVSHRSLCTSLRRKIRCAGLYWTRVVTFEDNIKNKEFEAWNLVLRKLCTKLAISPEKFVKILFSYKTTWMQLFETKNNVEFFKRIIKEESDYKKAKITKQYRPN